MVNKPRFLDLVREKERYPLTFNVVKNNQLIGDSTTTINITQQIKLTIGLMTYLVILFPRSCMGMRHKSNQAWLV